jgi:hypothetical protein
MSIPLLSWPLDMGRFTVKLSQGSDDRTLLTRIVFTAPPPHMYGETGFTNASRTYPGLAVRASDVLIMNSISEAPHALMRRTRITTRATEHYLQVATTTRDSELVSDWTFLSRWRAALFVGPSSGLWDHFKCWRISQATLDILSVDSDVRVCNAWLDESDTQWPVQSYDYSVPRDASSGDGTVRVHARRYDAMFVGYAIVTGSNEERRYPVIVDLESRRNYLPSEIDFMSPRPHLTLVAGAQRTTLVNLAKIDMDTAFTINTDSPEIILGLPFFRSNFSIVTYNAATYTLGFSCVRPPPTEAFRIMVSLLVLLQGALIIRWMGSIRVANLTLIVETLRAGAIDPLWLAFSARQTAYELLGVALSGITLFSVLPFANADYHVLFMLLVVHWAMHILFTLTFLGLSPISLRAITSGMRDSNILVYLPPHHVVARQAIHILLLGHGVLAGLLLSSDSLLVMLFSGAVAFAIIYHIAYHLSAMLVCTVGLADVSPGREGWFCRSSGWTLYFVLEVCIACITTVAFQQLLMVPVSGALNNFYWISLISYLSGIFMVVVVGAAAFTVLQETTPTPRI